MFTGIVEEKGIIRRIAKAANSCRLQVACRKVLGDLELGDSVAVNGVCLTVCRLDGTGFEADVMGETLARSALAQLKPGSLVNLERALALGGRLGGHLVSGHIDGTGTLLGRKEDQVATWLHIAAPPAIMRYVVEKGSMAIDGVSLTVAKLEEEGFQVSLIPHTAGATTLLDRKLGEQVNLENDLIGKYVERLLGTGIPLGRENPLGRVLGSNASWEKKGSGRGISWGWLEEKGF